MSADDQIEEQVEEQPYMMPAIIPPDIFREILHISNIPEDVKKQAFSLHNKDTVLGNLSNREVMALLYYARAVNHILSWYGKQSTVKGLQSLILTHLRLSRSKFGFQQKIFVDFVSRQKNMIKENRSIFSKIFG